MMVIVEQFIGSRLAVEPKCSEKTCPSATLSTTNRKWPDPGPNPGRRGGKPATNRLSYGAAYVHHHRNMLQQKSWELMSSTVFAFQPSLRRWVGQVLIGCSLCRLIRCSECLTGRHWYLPENWGSFIPWSPDQWISQCYANEYDSSFYCALFCVFVTRVNQCPISLRVEHPVERVEIRVIHE
jgi:hypothetical protein